MHVHNVLDDQQAINQASKQAWAPAGFFPGGCKPRARLVKDCSVYLWKTNTCCRISLCRIESDSDSVSDSTHDYCSEKNPKTKIQGGASAPPCTCLRAPLAKVKATNRNLFLQRPLPCHTH